MGFSTSGATLVIFLGVLVSASVFFPAAERGVEQVSDAVADRNDRVLDRRNAAPTIANATYDASDDAAVVNVTNAGAVTLSVEHTDLLLNGSIRTGDTAVDGVADRSLWTPGETLTVEVTGVPGPPERVTVVTEHGLERVTTNVTEVS